MKKKICLLGMLLALTVGASTVVSAAQTETTTPGLTVTLTNNNRLEYTGSLEDAFAGMAPGDTKTVEIKVQNNNSHAASFFIQTSDIQSLEETNRAAGGAYTFDLKVGNTSLLEDAEAGGYSVETVGEESTETELEASTLGLAAIEELRDFRYFAELRSGASTTLYLTLGIDGEGFDSITTSGLSRATTAVNYTASEGNIDLMFRAYYPDDRQPVVVTRNVTSQGENTIVTQIVDQIVPLASGVQTGDPVSIAVLLAILAAGVAVVTVAIKKRKVEK